MPLPDDDMHFGGDDFTQPDLSVPDGMLDMGGDEEQLNIDPRQLGLTTPDIAPAQTGVGQTPDEVAQGVEGVLLNLLQGGQHDVIMVMAGERPATAAAHPGVGNLRMAYASAVRTNPALRWYAKFAALLPQEKFSIREGSLQINMPAPMFRKVVTPFLSEFRADWARDSTITAAVRGMAASLQAADLRAKQQHLARGVRAQSNAEATDLDVANIGFGGNQLPDAPQTAEGVPFPAPAPAAPAAAPAAAEPGPVVPRLPISLTDLSLKAVVDHIATMDGDDDTMMSHLLDQGFPRSRANEILAMLRYKRVSEARRRALYEPQGNRGGGSVEFTFR